MPTARVLAPSRLKGHRVWLAYSRAGIEETQIFGSSVTDTGQREKRPATDGSFEIVHVQ